MTENVKKWYNSLSEDGKIFLWGVVVAVAIIIFVIVNTVSDSKNAKAAAIREAESRRNNVIQGIQNVMPNYTVNSVVEESVTKHTMYSSGLGLNNIYVSDIKDTDIVVIAYYSMGGSIHYSVYEPGKERASNNWSTKLENSTLNFDTNTGEQPDDVYLLGVYDPATQTLYCS